MKKTLWQAGQELRDAWLDLCLEITNALYLREIANWLTRLLRGVSGKGAADYHSKEEKGGEEREISDA